MEFNWVWYCHNCRETIGWEGKFPKCPNCKKKTVVIKVYDNHLLNTPIKRSDEKES